MANDRRNSRRGDTHQKEIAIARAETGFDHIEGSESRFQRW
jgi:hypothetical protein